jgi:hypothetical protein
VTTNNITTTTASARIFQNATLMDNATKTQQLVLGYA